MNKNIIICSDGTGNTAYKNRGTNVFKVFEAVDVNGHKWQKELKPQVAIYDDGVGAQSFKLFRILGGAFGWGLSRNVKQLYRELSRVYEPGDDIYVFGFSRGAFTVRTLVGLIAECGLPRPKAHNNEKELAKLVKNAYSKYRQRHKALLSHLFLKPKPWIENNFYTEIPIKFVGVWDTVDAVGLPFDEATWLWNKLIYRFTFDDKRLYKKVAKACHAISLDDERKTFHPQLWDEKEEETDRIEQVWFSGVHSNVGGGYPKQGMSLVPLHWMMSKAHKEGQGLRFLNMDWDNYRDHRNVCGKLYNSRAGLAVYYRYKPREFVEICEEQKIKIKEHKVHLSVLERITQEPEGYAPGNLPQKFKVVSDMENWDDKNIIGEIIANKLEPDKALFDRI